MDTTIYIHLFHSFITIFSRKKIFCDNSSPRLQPFPSTYIHISLHRRHTCISPSPSLPQRQKETAHQFRTNILYVGWVMDIKIVFSTYIQLAICMFVSASVKALGIHYNVEIWSLYCHFKDYFCFYYIVRLLF